jgi:phosphoribosylanthranilate isomerase
MKRTRIKICGFCSTEEAVFAAELGCDAIGLNFFEKSPRSVSIERAAEICSALPAFVNKVALFVNPNEQLVEEVLNNVQVDTLQFHGNEHADYCKQFGQTYLKAVSVKASDSPETLEQIFDDYSSASSILLDSFDQDLFGGTGTSFDWSKIPEAQRSRVILAGGLNPENVEDAIKQIQPYGVDVSSGVEGVDSEGKPLKGKKDSELMKSFIESVYRADLAVNH